MAPIRVTVWNEYLDEKQKPPAREIYPRGIHTAVAEALREDPRFLVRTATLEQPECGLSEETLRETDVLFWWGHSAHERVPEATADRVCHRVLEGMGFVALHSGLFSRPMNRLIGTRMACRYREAGERERMWVVDPAHPLCQGLDVCLEIPHSEMYGEPTGLPAPDELAFISWYAGGEVLRSGCCYHRGQGRIAALTPGHEEYPIYYLPQIRTLLRNAAAWAYHPHSGISYPTGDTPPLEPLKGE